MTNSKQGIALELYRVINNRERRDIIPRDRENYLDRVATQNGIGALVGVPVQAHSVSPMLTTRSVSTGGTWGMTKKLHIER